VRNGILSVTNKNRCRADWSDWNVL